MIPHTVTQVCWSLALVLTAAYALWRGGRPERLAASTCLAANFASIVAQRPRAWFQPQPVLLAIDIALLLIMVLIMIRSRRWWPVAAVAFQALAVGMPLMKYVDPKVMPMSYYVGAIIWNYVGLLILALGVTLEGGARDSSPSPDAGPASR